MSSIIEAKLLVLEYFTIVEQSLKRDAILCSIKHVTALIDCVPSVDSFPPNFGVPNKKCREYWLDIQRELRQMLVELDNNRMLNY